MGGFSVAVDVGAGSVKLLAAEFDGNAIRQLATVEFPNEAVGVLGSIYIDVFGVFEGIRKGIAGFCAELGECGRIGIDTYGNGYGILDARGRLIGMPYHYRDDRTLGTLERIEEVMPLEELYRVSGIYPVRSRVLAQLYQDVLDGSPSMKEGRTFLPFANLLTYFLSGEAVAERSIASVESLLDPVDGDWNFPLFERLSVPCGIFPRIVEGGTVAGMISPASQVGEGARRAKVMNVLCHDTESALLSAPLLDAHSFFVSLGTSIIVGARTEKPVISHAAYESHFKTVSGAFGANSLCKDFPGFWILERCREEWRKEGEDVSYQRLEALAASVERNSTYLDVCDPVFRANPAKMTGAIREYCSRTSQPVVVTIGSVVRCLYESFALQVGWCLDCLEGITGERNRTTLVAVNGGTRNGSLLQMLADATALDVEAGSPIASSIGNVLAQLYADGELSSPDDLRAVAGRSCVSRVYRARRTSKWDDALGFMRERGFLTG